MRAGYFLVILFAFCLCLHLLRFPHLILENGGGAFLILFFVILNVLAFPMLIVEKAIDNKLQEIDIWSLISLKTKSSLRFVDKVFVFSWFGLRLGVLLCFLWFFLYVGSSCILYLFFFASRSMDWTNPVTDIPNLPNLSLNFLAPSLWVIAVYLVFTKFFKRFLWLFTRWILPLTYAVLLVLFLKIIFMVNDFEGLKILFYPDFSALSANALLASISQSLACLFIGFGFYNRFFRAKEDVDSIEIFVRAILMAILVAIMVGVMALPMIEQVSETPFGSNWLFQILPRWLTYGAFGNYYCSLFFLSFSLLCFFVTVALHLVVSENIRLLFSLKGNPKLRLFLNVLFLFSNVAMVLILQNDLQGWSGQSLLLNIDRVVIQALLPLFALMMVWLLFRFTNRGERLVVFSQQQIFFHNRFFYGIWEKTAQFVVPSLIVLAWLLAIFL